MRKSIIIHALSCLLIMTVMAGCGSSPKDMVAKHRAELVAKLDSFDRIASQLATLKAATGAITIPAGAPTVELPDLKEAREKEVHNTLVFAADDFLDPDNKEDTFSDMYEDRFSLQMVQKMVRQGAFDGDERKLRRALELILRARYAVVLCTTKIDIPEIIRENPVSESSVHATFKPGHFEGNAQIFDLAKGDLLGGFMISADSSKECRSYTAGGNVSDELQKRVIGDLRSQVRVALSGGIRKNIPGARVP